MPLQIIDHYYTDSLGRTNKQIKDNAFDPVTTTVIVEIDSVINLSASVQVVKNGNVFTLTNGTWQEVIGASDGANIDFSLGKKLTPVITTTATWVDGADMYLANDGNFPDGAYTKGFFEMTDSMEGFNLWYNLVKNNYNGTRYSLIDGNTQRFDVKLVNALTVGGGTDQLKQFGNKSGGSIMSGTVDRIADVSSKQRYQFDIDFKIWMGIDSSPYYADDCIGDFIQIHALPDFTNSNVYLSVTNKVNGDTGLENEALNGGSPDYTLTSITWTDSAVSTTFEAFDYTQNSRFEIVIEKDSGNFNAGDKFDLKMFFIANDSAEYENLAKPHDNNIMLCMNSTPIAQSTPTTVAGNENSNNSGIDITNLNFVTSGSTLTVTGIVEPNANFTTEFEARAEDDRKYKIWVVCQDATLGIVDKDKVNVLADFQDSVKDILPLGNWSGLNTFEMLDHNSTSLANPAPIITEDDLLMNIDFTLPKSTTNDWSYIEMRCIAERISTGDRFTLESTNYDISNLPAMPDDTLSVSFTEDRGFKLPSNRRTIEVGRKSSLDTGSDFGVYVLYPFISRYEYWFKLITADTYFYGNRKKNWEVYSADADWQLKFELALGNDDGEYIDSFNFNITDYDQWGETPGSSIIWKDQSGTVLTKPLMDEISHLIVEHELDTETWNGNEWGIIRIRPKEGAPQWYLSTVFDITDTNNPLVPRSGETRCKMTVSGSKVTLECDFDPDKIDWSAGLTTTSRVDGDYI